MCSAIVLENVIVFFLGSSCPEAKGRGGPADEADGKNSTDCFGEREDQSQRPERAGRNFFCILCLVKLTFTGLLAFPQSRKMISFF